MMALANDPDQAGNSAIPLRRPGPRMSRSELTELFYHADLSGRLTPAEMRQAPEGAQVAFERSWKRLSGFGRWTAC